ncbi:GTPase/DUF3482 domain-containing protein [Orrella sp. JC864]|uniref:GTPase/DUF3482 domain-containing protein n=1 Tax=Orrella sp. JC864 TaxID=3120298 RepID=UPI0012BBD9A4
MPEPAGAPLKLAVVGHTNTGKTSLLRTLTRDPGFGKVADEPGTTRHVEGTRLMLHGEPVLELFDTPGLEDGIALRDYLEQLPRPAGRLDGPARIARFLDTPEARGRFEQEARVLAKLLACDAALYVIDARDPVLSKHRDELALLADCGRPILPVINFVHSDNRRTPEWRAALSRLGLHAQVEFDTVAPALDGERQLYTRLGMLLDQDRNAGLERLVQDLETQRMERRRAALRLVAELLIDAAALKVPGQADEAAMQAAAQALQSRVRQREQACVLALLSLYNFRASDYAAGDLPLTGNRWGMDLFNPQALRDMGIQVGKGAAAGAMAGAAVDVMLAGLSLGTGMLVGAAAGGLWQGGERWGKRLLGRLRGRQELSVGDDVLRLLAVRQCLLADALERRGHAARDPVTLQGTGADSLRRGPLPSPLRDARGQPHWSACGDDYQPGSAREQAIGLLAQALLEERDTALRGQGVDKNVQP